PEVRWGSRLHALRVTSQTGPYALTRPRGDLVPLRHCSCVAKCPTFAAPGGRMIKWDGRMARETEEQDAVRERDPAAGRAASEHESDALPGKRPRADRELGI